jgi:hypothetical protein
VELQTQVHGAVLQLLQRLVTHSVAVTLPVLAQIMTAKAQAVAVLVV